MSTETVMVWARRFTEDLRLLNYSERTVEDYAYNLRHFERFLDEVKTPLEAVTPSSVGLFQRWVFDRPKRTGEARSVANQNRILIQTRAFLRFLGKEGVFGRDPTEGLELAREPQTLPKNILTPKEAKRLIESVDTSHVRGYRDRVLLEILYGSGIRSQELINLTVKDVNFEEELLRINGGKGAKDRVVPLSRMACRMLETYIKGVRPELLHGRKTDRLFLSWRGRPLHRYNLSKIIQAHAKRAGIPKRMTTHIWRHTCATHLLKNNVNLRYVQELLGHRSLATTEKYLRVTITDLKEAHRKFHPREKGLENPPDKD